MACTNKMPVFTYMLNIILDYMFNLLNIENNKYLKFYENNKNKYLKIYDTFN